MKRNETGSDSAGAGGPDAPLDERLQRLKGKLESSGTNSRSAELKDGPPPAGTDTRSGIAQAMRLSSEFIAGVVVGAVIGYAIDTWLGTSPWGMIVFLMLGFAAAVLNVLRAAGMVEESGLRPNGSGASPTDTTSGDKGEEER